jgi:hypothetical protein
VPDRRVHRGPHPEDARLFAPEAEPRLRCAVGDLCWLASRGYADASALKLVGDRYELLSRQRIAVARAACSDAAHARRREHEMSVAALAGETLAIDGYNLLTTIEATLSHGVILACRDGCYRDMASMHGSYRKVQETVPALELIGAFLSEQHVAQCRWLLDSPVSNSGRLKQLMRELADKHGWNWQIELVANPDAVLCATDTLNATADSAILDRANRWVNLARVVVTARIPDARVVDLSVDA